MLMILKDERKAVEETNLISWKNVYYFLLYFENIDLTWYLFKSNSSKSCLTEMFDATNITTSLPLRKERLTNT